jgi:dTMP kinase
MLQVPEATAKKRLAQRGDAADRYDLLGPDFMARIAAGFRDIAANAPDRCVIIDAAGDAESVFAAILSALTERGLA